MRIDCGVRMIFSSALVLLNSKILILLRRPVCVGWENELERFNGYDWFI